MKIFRIFPPQLVILRLNVKDVSKLCYWIKPYKIGQTILLLAERELIFVALQRSLHVVHDGTKVVDDSNGVNCVGKEVLSVSKMAKFVRLESGGTMTVK